MLSRETSKAQIDGFLADHFSSLEQATSHQGEGYSQMLQVTREVALAGGKRLRPYMSMLTYEAYTGEDSSKMLPIAAAQEIMHTAMLVHDDIMDGDLTRHGQPNVTSRLMDAYVPYILDEEERRRRAEYAALLAGDLLEGEAFGLMEDLEGFDPKVMGRTRKLFRNALRTVVGGQLHDIEAPFLGADAISPRDIARDKTAHYTFVTPLLVGATLAEAPDDELEKLQVIGEKTGIAYQLRDDILGVFGDPTVTGKSVDGDLREGKRTLLSEVFETTADGAQRDLFRALQAQTQLDQDDSATLQQMRSMLKPAKAIIEQEILETSHDVGQRISQLAMRPGYRQALRHLMMRSLKRTH